MLKSRYVCIYGAGDDDDDDDHHRHHRRVCRSISFSCIVEHHMSWYAASMLSTARMTHVFHA